MDMMEIRRRVLQAMASGGNVRIKTGTFAGNDSRTIVIPCDFIPDIVITSLIADEQTPLTFMGNMYEAIIRDEFSVVRYDNNSSTFGAAVYSTTAAEGMTGLNATGYSTRQAFATADGTAVTIDHNTGTNVWSYYTGGYTYNYMFIKYTE